MKSLLLLLLALQVRAVDIRLIVVRTAAEATDILTRVRGGEAFEALARSRSVDASAANGGSLGVIPFANLRREFQEGLAGLTPGQTSPVIRLNGSFALLQLVGEKGTEVLALRDAVVASNVAQVKSLLESGADANLTFDDGSTILMAAAQSGNSEIVAALLKAGAKPNAQARNGSTALLEAAFGGHSDAVKLLLDAGADSAAQLEDGSTILMKAALAGHADVVKALFAGRADPNAKTPAGLTALMQASFAGQTPIVQILLDAGADVNARLGNGSTALMAAAQGGHVEVIRALLAKGADANAASANGGTALMEAANAGRLDAARVLLDSRADVNASLRNGMTALMGAALGGHTEIVKMLMAAGANVSARDSKGQTAVTHAAASANSETVVALLTSRADVSPQERSLLLGGTYVNEYYSSNDKRLLDRATEEFQKVLQAAPTNLRALQWTAAVEFLRWDGKADSQQFRKTNALLKACLALDPKNPERNYWIAAIDSTYGAQAKGLSSVEYNAILNEGIDQARKAIEASPDYWEALAFLNTLYKQKAERATVAIEKEGLLKLAETAARDAVRLRDARRAQPSRPTDQFSTPAPPAPPALEFEGR